MNETQEKLSPEMDAGIAALIAGLENECRRDLLEATRAQGLVATEMMVAQAGMLAGMAVRVLMRRVQVLKVRCTELDEKVAGFNAAYAEAYPDTPVAEGGAHYNQEVLPQIAEGIGQGLVGEGIPRIDTMTGEGATSWIATVFCLAANPEEPPAPPPAIVAPSRIVRP